jgi:hypothetical protein
MQDDKADPPYMRFLRTYMRATATVSSLRNLCDLLPYLPVDAETQAFKKKGETMLEHRLAMGKTRNDIFSYLLGEDTDSGKGFSRDQLNPNAQLIIVAGTGV